MIFDGQPGDVWAYAIKDVLTQPWKLAFYKDDASVWDYDLVVNGGLFKFSSYFHVEGESTLHKRGDGDIWVNGQMRQSQHNQANLPTLSMEGGTVFASRDGLREVNLRLVGGSLSFTNQLEGGRSSLLGRYISEGNAAGAIRLNGGMLESGFAGPCVFADEFASDSPGRLAAVGTQTTLLTVPPPAGVTLAALDGTLAVRAGNRPAPLGLWRFEDAANPCVNSGTWTGTLQPTGAGCTVVDDPERGSVLRVANGSFLSGTLTGIQPNQPYTVAVWFRADSATDPRGTFVAFGGKPLSMNLVVHRWTGLHGHRHGYAAAISRVTDAVHRAPSGRRDRNVRPPLHRSAGRCARDGSCRR